MSAVMRLIAWRLLISGALTAAALALHAAGV
jgi:hypothetical protein